MEKNQEILNTFMQAWIVEDYEKMFEHCQKTWKEGRKAEDLQILFSFLRLKDCRIISTTTTTSVARKFTTELTFDNGDKVVSGINVICETAPYKTATFGEWGVNPVSVMNVVQQMAGNKPEPEMKEEVKEDDESKEKRPVKKSTKKIAGEIKKDDK